MVINFLKLIYFLKFNFLYCIMDNKDNNLNLKGSPSNPDAAKGSFIPEQPKTKEKEQENRSRVLIKIKRGDPLSPEECDVAREIINDNNKLLEKWGPADEKKKNLIKHLQEHNAELQKAIDRAKAKKVGPEKKSDKPKNLEGETINKRLEALKEILGQGKETAAKFFTNILKFKKSCVEAFQEINQEEIRTFQKEERKIRVVRNEIIKFFETIGVKPEEKEQLLKGINIKQVMEAIERDNKLSADLTETEVNLTRKRAENQGTQDQLVKKRGEIPGLILGVKNRAGESFGVHKDGEENPYDAFQNHCWQKFNEIDKKRFLILKSNAKENYVRDFLEKQGFVDVSDDKIAEITRVLMETQKLTEKEKKQQEEIIRFEKTIEQILGEKDKNNIGLIVDVFGASEGDIEQVTKFLTGMKTGGAEGASGGGQKGKEKVGEKGEDSTEKKKSSLESAKALESLGGIFALIAIFLTLLISEKAGKLGGK